jgi:hypothetical protein
VIVIGCNIEGEKCREMNMHDEKVEHELSLWHLIIIVMKSIGLHYTNVNEHFTNVKFHIYELNNVLF